MNESIEQYKTTVSLLEDLIEFHPTYLHELTETDRDVLSQYYFAGREIDVDDLGEYRDQLIATDPGIETQAQVALARFKAAAHIQ